VLVPWTTEGMKAAEPLPSGPPVPRWLSTPQPTWGGADAVSAVVAGALPWHALGEDLEPEFQADVDKVQLPSWIDEMDESRAPMFAVGGRGPVRWLAPRALDRETEAVLGRLSATPAAVDDPASEAGTLLWLSTDPLPPALVDRPATTRLLVVPGSDAELDPSWTAAEWVLSGSRAAVLEAIHDSPWAPLHG